MVVVGERKWRMTDDDNNNGFLVASNDSNDRDIYLIRLIWPSKT